MNKPRKKITVSSPEATMRVARNMANTLTTPTIIYLSGQLGSGKTTFVRGFLRGLGFDDSVKSPTYSLVESYEINSLTVHHFDFYRLNDPQEIKAIGIDEYFLADICLVEWPEQAYPLLPTPDLMARFELPSITLHAETTRGETMLARLNW